MIDLANRLAGGLAILLCLVMIAATLIEVIVRRGFNDPTIWSNDVVTMSGGAFFLLAAGTTLLYDRHIKVDIFVHRVPVRLRHGFLAATFLLGLGPTVAIIAHAATTRAWTSFQRGARETVSAWEPLIWPYQAAIAAALILFGFQIVAQGLRHALAVNSGAPLNAPYRSAPETGTVKSGSAG